MSDDRDDRITDRAPRGQHIALVCVNHPDLNWNTKNIGGSDVERVWFERTIFFNEGSPFIPECSCPATALRLHPQYKELEACAP